MGFLPLKQRVNCDENGFATKQRMFELLIIDEGPLLSMTDGRAVAHFKLVWWCVLTDSPPHLGQGRSKWVGETDPC